MGDNLNQPQEVVTDATIKEAGNETVTDAVEVKSGEIAEGQENTSDNNEEKSESTVEKKFTQEELDTIVKQRIEKERKKFEKANPQEELEQLRNEVIRYKNEAEITKYGVKDEFKDYVMFKVNGMSKDVDFATSLKTFFDNESNKKYLNGFDTKPVSMPRPNNIGTSDLDPIKAKYGEITPLNKGRI